MQYVIHEQEAKTRLPPQTTVALKVFYLRTQPVQPGHTETRQNIFRAMLREINVYSHPRLSRHPNLVRLLFVGWWPNNTFPALAIELGSYGSLDDAIKGSYFKPSILQRRHITIDIAMGLYAIHSVDFLHGDLKPENVLLMFHKDPARGFTAKITDFGGSAGELTGKNSKPAYYTRLWAAPEVENHDIHLDWKKADVYSYGLLIGSLWASNGVEFFDQIRNKRSSCFLSNAIDPLFEGHENAFLFLVKTWGEPCEPLSYLFSDLSSTDMDSTLQKEITELVEGPLQTYFWLRPSMEELLVHLASFASCTRRNILCVFFFCFFFFF
ncbi:kinase-like domain-containing protein [Trichoderma evansii]